MKVDLVILKYMLESMSEGIREMFQVLRTSPTLESLPELARIAHKLKGEATVVGFSQLSLYISRLEDSVHAYQKLQAVKSTHFQTLACHLKTVVGECERIRKTALRAQATSKQQVPPNPTKDIASTLEILAQNVSRSCGKSVRLNLEKFQLSGFPALLQKKLQDIAVQLVRNAITHGIETPEERKANGKAVTGTISVSIQKQKRIAILTVRDDGKGIELEKIRRRLILEYNRPVQDVATLSEQVLLDAVFLPGFSTVTVQQAHAGRGVGLDLVKDTATRLGGAVSVQFCAQKCCQFVVRIPIQHRSGGTAIPLLVNAVVANIPLLKRNV